MFRSICKTLIHHGTPHSKSTNVRFVQTISSLKSVSKGSNPTDKQSLTLSFLTNSCGLSSESAISASKIIRIESTEKPDLVLELLTSKGFTKTHIATLISRHPKLILADPERTLRPKIEFFESLGLPDSDVTRILSLNPRVLSLSLKNKIIPVFEFLRGFVKTKEDLIRAFKRSPRVPGCNIPKVMVPNISTLRAHGVPEPLIAKVVLTHAHSLMMNVTLFKEVASAIKEMGIHPASGSFILAVRTMSTISKKKWEKKKGIFLSFGWSEDQFHSAFRVQPICMQSSEEKIRRMMDFLVTKAGLKPSDVAKCPNLFLTSLERRIIPRCSVLQVLMSKGLIKKNVDIVWVLNSNKKTFEMKFLNEYKEVAPEVIKAYHGEMGFQGFKYGLPNNERRKNLPPQMH